jgi:uncharacterized membrane protein YkvI
LTADIRGLRYAIDNRRVDALEAVIYVGKGMMKQTIQNAGREIMKFAIGHGFLGILALIVSAAFLSNYLELGQQRWLYRAAGMLACGATMLLSSYFLYRRRPNATITYALSWSQILFGWIALSCNLRPVWWVISTSVCLAIGAAVLVAQVHRLSAGRGLQSK